MLSEALRLIRVFHDMKQRELAEKLGVSNSLISEIEAGKKKPSLELIDRYSSEFDIPSSSVLFFRGNLDDQSNIPNQTNRAKQTIARKVIQFLNLIEETATTND